MNYTDKEFDNEHDELKRPEFIEVKSLNLICYLRSRGFKQEYIKAFRGCSQNIVVIYVFKNSFEINNSIRAYKEDLFLQELFGLFRIVKEEIYSEKEKFEGE